MGDLSAHARLTLVRYIAGGNEGDVLVHGQGLTSGVAGDNPAWLGGLIARGYTLHCGFDADQPGDDAAARMIALHPAIRRLRPSAHDWNDALAD